MAQFEVDGESDIGFDAWESRNVFQSDAPPTPVRRSESVMGDELPSFDASARFLATAIGGGFAAIGQDNEAGPVGDTNDPLDPVRPPIPQRRMRLTGGDDGMKEVVMEIQTLIKGLEGRVRNFVQIVSANSVKESVLGLGLEPQEDAAAPVVHGDVKQIALGDNLPSLPLKVEDDVEEVSVEFLHFARAMLQRPGGQRLEAIQQLLGAYDPAVAAAVETGVQRIQDTNMGLRMLPMDAFVLATDSVRRHVAQIAQYQMNMTGSLEGRWSQPEKTLERNIRMQNRVLRWFKCEAVWDSKKKILRTKDEANKNNAWVYGPRRVVPLRRRSEGPLVLPPIP